MRRIERENLPSSQLGITVMESQMNALLRRSPQLAGIDANDEDNFLDVLFL